jgi:hypothetical protein
MKKSFFTFIAFLLSASSFATILRVNNNPGVPLVSGLVFNNFNAALTAASVSVVDTIYLEPSDINYGAITITKKIVLIGPGYFLSKNPNTPFDKRSAMVQSISLGSQVSPSANSAGTVIYGISVLNNQNGLYGNITIGSTSSTFTSSNISIINCIFNSITRNTFGGFEHSVQKCFITGDIPSLSSNSAIQNCIILGAVSAGTVNNIIKNNIIYGGLTPNGAMCFNNIIFPTTSPSLSFPNESNVFNNVCVGCSGTPSFNNFFTTAANTIFQVAEPRIFDDLWDERFKLATTSPAKAKGVSGIDCGVFAGIDPYTLSGVPPFPMISAFTQGAPSGGNIPITISIRRN